jgi:pyrimidine operon attenuation protein/uracil phosphoribosyltransferase
MEKKQILTGSHAAMKLRRMAYEILEENPGEKQIILAGIRNAGSVVAAQLQAMLSGISDMDVQVVSLLLDKRHPTGVEVSDPVDFNGKVVILVDDVTNSGRTLLYALKPFLSCHPKKIQTLVLVERSHKSFPIHPDFTGLRLSTTIHEQVVVEVDQGEITGAYLM